MRKRSTTLYAESVEDYTMQALAASTQSYDPNGMIRRSNSKKKINLSALNSLETIHKDTHNNNLSLSNSKASTDAWSEFDFDGDRQDPTYSTDDSSKFSSLEDKQAEESLYGTDSTEDTVYSSPDIIKKSVTKKCMVIGLNGTGRHSLVNSIFESQGKGNQSPLRQTMDLIIKNHKENGCETKYQFWMRALNDNRFDGLIKVYYRNASIFFFTYSITDKQSFEMLDEAIESVLKEVPKEKFVGILLGNKSDLERQRKVSFAEGTKLKEKYGLSLFLETYLGDKESKDQLFSFVNGQS